MGKQIFGLSERQVQVRPVWLNFPPCLDLEQSLRLDIQLRMDQALGSLAFNIWESQQALWQSTIMTIFSPQFQNLHFPLTFPKLTTRTTNYFYAHGSFQNWSKLGWKIRGFVWALVYWVLSKTLLCLGVGRRNNARAINICSLPAKEFPCKLHQSPEISWHAIFSFLLLILEAVTVTDWRKCSANPSLNKESFQLPFNFLFNLYFHTSTVFSVLILQFRRGIICFQPNSQTIWFSHCCVFHNSSLIEL